MWYFAWVLGVLLAASFAITNALWLEVNENMDRLDMDYDRDEDS